MLAMIGYAYGGAGRQIGPEAGPVVLRHAMAQRAYQAYRWQPLIVGSVQQTPASTLEEVVRLAERLASTVRAQVSNHRPFCVVGGDHSSAIGTWAGVRRGTDQTLGLIWIDAHLDSHTPDSSLTGNIHGMPLAVLLGHGDPCLLQVGGGRVIQPEHVCVIGARSYEDPEYALLKQLGVKIYSMETISQRGLDQVWQEALAYIQTSTDCFGVSIDLDAIDPEEAPAVTVPEPGGIHAQDLCALMPSLFRQGTRCIGVEIVEFAPELDQDQRTLECILQMVEGLLSGLLSEYTV